MGSATPVPLRRTQIVVSALLLLCASTLLRSGQESAEPVELIVVDSSGEARVLLAKIKNGEEFGTLAHEYSTDPTANDGGYLGEVKMDALRPELAGVLRRMKPGEVSDVVKIPAGYAIVKLLTEPKPASPYQNPVQRRDGDGFLGVRLAPDISGYAEFYESFRQSMPPESSRRAWQLDLNAVCSARRQAPRNAIKALQDRIANLGSTMDPFRLAYTHYTLGQLWSSQADFDKALPELETTYQIAQRTSNDKLAWHMEEVLAATYLRRGSSDPASDAINKAWIFPSHPGALRTKRADVEKAIGYLTRCVRRDPSNTEFQWLLNLAYMMADGYPTQVPKDLLIPPSVFQSKEDIGLFLDVAPAAGLGTFGTAGGVIMDDFDNDGLLDVVTSQVDDCAPLRFFHNNGDGTFTDRSGTAGITGQMGGLNIIQADYDNDGCTDILILRGGWEFPRRPTLLQNECDGTFTDVTADSGLLNGPLRASQSAVWLDIDNDGNLDLFIANENAPSQLFLNKGDGTFVDISHQAGIDKTATSKSVVSADYDNDGYPDIYVSNFNGKDFLYHNNGNRTFTEVSQSAGVSDAPWMSFAAWFFDYDNDGRPDLFVTGFYMSLEEVARSYMGMPRKGETLKLYRNLGNGKFQDVTSDVGLDRVFMPMGSNFGDIDNDGFLDIYLGNGSPSFVSLMPNVLLHNDEGKRFVDITASSGTGALAKGHGVAFADLNNDGDEDLFIVMGGPSPGDTYPSRLFENPGKHGNDWITLRLVGVTSNRSAIGARIAVTVLNEGQKQRTIWRTVGSGGSFGASPLQQHIGLGKSAAIQKIEVWWPASKTKQTFENVAPNQFLEIREFGKSVTKLKRPVFQLGGPARRAQNSVAAPK